MHYFASNYTRLSQELCLIERFFVCFSFERNDSLIYVFPSSKLSIVCPNPSTVLKTARDSISKNELYQNFWIVSRESYERCDTSQGSRLLLKCNEPLRLKYFTLVFQEYSAVNHPVYIPGEEYYFIGKLSITKSLRARHFNTKFCQPFLGLSKVS